MAEGKFKVIVGNGPPREVADEQDAILLATAKARSGYRVRIKDPNGNVVAEWKKGRQVQ